MPLISTSAYQRPFFLLNGHMETIYPAIFRKVSRLSYRRERLTLSDGDFVDLDWVDNDSRQLVLLTHGLEGNSDRHYIKGMAKRFVQAGWDALAWNCRSCSGEMNKKLRLYFHGEIGDIAEVIEHALQQKDYEKIVLVGFSMGGNISLKYLGANAHQLPKAIYKAIAISSPCNLESSAHLLDAPGNGVYRRRFMNKLKVKVTHKAQQFPNVVDLANFERIEVWKDFDDYFSAPINGYKNAEDLYYHGSAIHFMPPINVPVLILNAQNDPILNEDCSPIQLAQKHSYIYVEQPKFGGHVGFSQPMSTYSWAEERAIEFVEAL